MKNIFLSFILFTFSAVLIAQRNDTSLDITMQVISWQEMVEYDRLHAPDSARINARIATRHKGKVHPERSTMLSEGLQSSDPHGVMEAKMRAASPLPTATFAGLGDNNNYIPPDVQGAAGPNHLMIALNTEFRIQNRAGMVLSTVSIFSFFSGFPTALPFDPRIVYDPYSKRWIIVTASDDNMSTSSLFVAASHSADPTGNWNIYRIFVDPQNQTTWIDYPQIGLNKRWLTIAGAMYTIASPPAVPQFSSAKFYIFDKASLYGGNPVPPFQLINTSSMGENMAPVFTHDTTTSSVFLLQNHNGNINGNGILNLYKISGQLGSAVLTQVAQINTPNPWADIPPQTDFAPQLNTTSKISLNDSRILDAVYRNHTIWGVHHIFLPVSNIARCAVQFWQIDTTGQVIQRGRIDDQSGGIFYGFPSIDVNCNDDALIGFSTFSSTQYASAAYAFREGCDTLNTIRTPFQYKNGLATYHKTYSGMNTNRWGDFTATWVDTNDLDFWTLQQYAEIPASSGQWPDRWGTWWAKVNAPCTPPAPPVFTQQPPYHCVAQTEIYKTTLPCGADTLLWNASGMWGVLASAADSAAIVAGNWQSTISAIAHNKACNSFSIPVSAQVNPITTLAPPPAIHAPPQPLCEGETYTFTVPMIVGATGYQWQVIGPGWSGSSTTDSCDITVGQGQATINVFTMNQCGASLVPATIIVHAVPKPLASFTVSQDSLLVDDTLTVHFFPTPFPDAWIYWQWDGGTPLQVDTNKYKVSWPVSGQKVISAFADDGICLSDVFYDTVWVVTDVGINGVTQQLKITFVPVPVDKNVYLFSSGLSEKQQISISFYSISGMQVKEEKGIIHDGHPLEMDLSKLPSGTYLYELVVKNTMLAGKISVLHQ